MAAFSKHAAVLRIAMGWIFLWAFLDKLFGLGFATMDGKSWLDGVSPAAGFLSYGTSGPFASAFASLAGQAWVDWLFMAGLLGIGLALTFGVAMRLAAAGGSLLLGLMYLALLWPKNNPFIDEHLIYIASLALLARLNAGDTWGLGRWWKSRGFVKKMPWLT